MNGRRQFHETDDSLELYALDRLTGTDLTRVEDHLIICVECRERLENTAAFAFAVRDAFKENPSLAPAPASRGLNWFGWLRMDALNIAWKPQFALGAFAVIILATGAYFLGTRPNSAPIASLQLTAMRGDIQTVPAAKVLDLTFSDSPAGGGPFRVEVVDANGRSVWSGAASVKANNLGARIEKPLSPGTYFARMYDASGKLLHEYGLKVVSQ
jgi:hypothetical protein